MDCSGLAKDWEDSSEVRDLVIKERKLLQHPETSKLCLPTRGNCVSNAGLLKPILAKLHHVPAYRLPHLEPLQSELMLLVDKLGVTNIGDGGVYTAAVAVKKLLSLVKRRVRRKEVTKDWKVLTENCML